MAIGRPKKEVKALQLRFSVPTEDAVVLNWVRHQYNLSGSVRELIKDAVKKYGYGDYTCIVDDMELDLADKIAVSRSVNPNINQNIQPAQTPPVTQQQIPETYAEIQPAQPNITQQVSQQISSNVGQDKADALASLLS